MKKQYFINANIIDPHNSINENGGLIIGEDGKIEAIGKKVNSNNLPTREKPIDLKGKYIFPGLVDMRVFVGEPGYEYKENFRTLSHAALAGGVTSIVTMPNTKPIIDNVSMVDFIIRRGRDKANVNLFPCASITQQCEGKLMTENGLQVTYEDLKEYTKGFVKAQMAQFGDNQIEEKELEGIVTRVLSNQEEVRRLSDQLKNEKLLKFFKENIKLQVVKNTLLAKAMEASTHDFGELTGILKGCCHER